MSNHVKTLERYPNLQALGDGCVSTDLNNWPVLKAEARAALEERERLLERVSDLECVSGLKEVLEGCEHKARIDAVVADFNPKVDALVSCCGCCKDRVPFEVLVPDTLWSQIPEKYRSGVLCLSCADRLLPQGLDPTLIRIVYASTSRGTTAFVPVKALQGE